ncbi:hypothetical protein Tco_1399981 [Tanacetum coccineum]
MAPTWLDCVPPSPSSSPPSPPPSPPPPPSSSSSSPSPSSSPPSPSSSSSSFSYDVDRKRSGQVYVVRGGKLGQVATTCEEETVGAGLRRRGKGKLVSRYDVRGKTVGAEGLRRARETWSSRYVVRRGENRRGRAVYVGARRKLGQSRSTSARKPSGHGLRVGGNLGRGSGPRNDEDTSNQLPTLTFRAPKLSVLQRILPPLDGKLFFMAAPDRLIRRKSLSQRHVPLGAEAPTACRQTGGGTRVASSPDSDLEASVIIQAHW